MKIFLSLMNDINEGKIIKSLQGKIPMTYIVDSPYLDRKIVEYKIKEPNASNLDVFIFLQNLESDMQKYIADIQVDKNDIYTNNFLNKKLLVEREKEIQMIHLYLNREYKNNVILVGEPGVGKTSLINNYLHNYKKSFKIISISELVANTKYRGEFENRLNELIESSKINSEILFFDEIHNLLNLGNTEGGVSAGDILKPIITDSSLQIIGATTPSEVNILLKDKAFKRRFNFLKINEPKLDALKSIYEYYIDYFQLSDEENRFDSIISFLDETYNDRYYPDKLIDFIDFWGSAKKSLKLNYDETIQLYTETQINEVKEY
ncbi:MAG: AAA family ATPase [Lactobacillaceae bacterium]|jgi:ATP-dependent Clp protease ATP-binding subunit ClpC|nr:AAA family ATPase [Lactobacillaceae bacterium]